MHKFLTRRKFSALAGGVALSRLQGQIFDPSPNRLHAPDLGSSTPPVPPGLHPLGLRTERDALLYVPESSANFDRAPLVLSLHGASRDATRGISLLQSLADEHGFLLLAPATPGGTWDVITGPGGRDAEFINRSLARTVALRQIDKARIAMAGFSDGASCSLALGLANGDFFRAVLAFSPGFVPPLVRVGKPPIFISHGTVDQVLPIDECSRRIVPQLKREGYRVTYQEFEGKHELPPAVASQAMRWFMEMHA